MSDMQRTGARDTALEVLMQVSRANAWSDGSLKRTIAKNRLDSREAALCTRLPTALFRTGACWTIISAAGVPRSRTGWSR